MINTRSSAIHSNALRNTVQQASISININNINDRYTFDSIYSSLFILVHENIVVYG